MSSEILEGREYCTELDNFLDSNPQINKDAIVTSYEKVLLDNVSWNSWENYSWLDYVVRKAIDDSNDWVNAVLSYLDIKFKPLHVKMKEVLSILPVNSDTLAWEITERMNEVKKWLLWVWKSFESITDIPFDISSERQLDIALSQFKEELSKIEIDPISLTDIYIGIGYKKD